MDLKLVRGQFRKDGIFGSLLDEYGNELAVTLEHAYQDGTDFWPKLPDGVYRCVRGIHHFNGATTGFETFEITKVPGHTGILFHVGNYNKDSDGCILVGRNIVPIADCQAISASALTFDDLMDFLEEVNEFTLTVASIS